MSNEQSEMMGTKPVAEHEWLQQLVGEWTYVSEYVMEPGGQKQTGAGTESVKSLGGLWAYAENHSSMPDGEPMVSYVALGYDVSFKEYRGCWFGSMSSHLWKYTGTLSADGKTMRLRCEGPDMVNDGQTAIYEDVVEIIDADHRTLTSYGPGNDGQLQEFMKNTYTRA